MTILDRNKLSFAIKEYKKIGKEYDKRDKIDVYKNLKKNLDKDLVTNIGTYLYFENERKNNFFPLSGISKKKHCIVMKMAITPYMIVTDMDLIILMKNGKKIKLNI